MNDWYIIDGGQLDGPYSLRDLKEMLRDGDLAPSEKVQQGQAGTPIAVKNVPELRSKSGARRSGKKNAKNDNAVIWIVLACVFGGGLLLCCVLIVPALLLPAVQQTREAARRSQSQDHLHNQIIALHDYEVNYRQLPPGASVDDVGTPMHGWATIILPFVEQKPLYDQIRPKETYFDDPTLRTFFTHEIDIYMNSSVAERRDSSGLALIHYAANQQIFFTGSETKFFDIRDGTSNTIAIGEIGAGYPPWGGLENFRDPALGLGLSSNLFGRPVGGGCQVGLLDGKVTMLDPSIDPRVLSALATPAGGEPVTLP